VPDTAGPDANEQHAIANGKPENGNLTFELPGKQGHEVHPEAGRPDKKIKGDITREREAKSRRPSWPSAHFVGQASGLSL
jgi:hypothetical protein